MTAAGAYATAAAEGLALVRADNAAGFKGVGFSVNVSKPFMARVNHGGHEEYLGYFATAEEAALAVARFLGPEGVAAALAPPPAPHAAAAAAHAAAAAEGLTLLRAANATGFKYVVYNTGGHGKPFKAQDGRSNYLGLFATAEEAALAVARFREAPKSPPQPAVPPRDRKRSASPSPLCSKRSKDG